MGPLLELPFEAASVHGTEFSFVDRDIAAMDGLDGPQRLAEAASRLSEAADRLLGRFFTTGTLPAALHMRARRFGRGSFGEPLRLNPPNSTHNDAVTFEPWKLAVCGDFLGQRQGLQEAALSGTMAANRVAQWAFQQS